MARGGGGDQDRDGLDGSASGRGWPARLFANRGYDAWATSVREIVEAAGVAKPTLYYHFQSKEGLAQALLTVPLTNLVDTIKRIVKTVEDPVLCLEQVIERAERNGSRRPRKTRIAVALSTQFCLVRPAQTWSASSSRSATAC